jgi:large subunit ribosomal protein L25
MSKTSSLKAEPRQRTGSGVLRLMRREGYVPSVVYGGGFENQNVKVNARDFRDLLAHSASENILVDLQLDGGGNQLAFLKDVQHDPLTGDVLHIDFLAVSDSTEITAQIPIEFVGEPEGVRMGGLLEQLLYTVEIKCLPKDLPATIEADVSELLIGDALHIGEVQWPAGVAPTTGEDVVLALVAKTRAGMSEEEAEAEAAEGGEGAGEAPKEEGGEDS